MLVMNAPLSWIIVPWRGCPGTGPSVEQHANKLFSNAEKVTMSTQGGFSSKKKKKKQRNNKVSYLHLHEKEL